ncbi:MAG: ATP-binding cassette domain-containing protein [Oscillospiraceae bacterium]|nr:ATP-binding cassette domain-containing protein [Oscillospiraceae bacterium]
MALELELEKKLGDFRLEMRLDAGDEVLALLGPSGCGKSATLRCAAGLLRPDRGRIAVDGETLFDSARGVDLPPRKRRAGLLFQNYALFPHMTVQENILSGCRRAPDRRARTDEMLERFALTPLAGRLPGQLSGGEQQRTALARILVSRPRILMLDEPFSALDSHLRFRMEQEVRQVIREFGKTVLLVSHSRDEVYRMADRVAVLRRGRVEVCGGKDAVFSDPQTRGAAILTGCKNISAIRPAGPGRVQALDWDISLGLPDSRPDAAFAGIRMHDLAPGPGPNGFRCEVVETIENPFSVTLLLRPVGTHGTPLGWETDKARRRAPGEIVEVHLPPEAILLLRD